MPTQREIRKMARARGISPKEESMQVFGHMRKLGWKPARQGGPTKAWGKHKK
jgi:hypothetical protein